MTEKHATESLEAFIANCSSDQNHCNVGKLALFKVELVTEQIPKKRRRRRRGGLELEVVKTPPPRLAKEMALKKGRKEVRPMSVRAWSRGTQTCEEEVLLMPTEIVTGLVEKVEKLLKCPVKKP